jgi:hypothetical protein
MLESDIKDTQKSASHNNLLDLQAQAQLAQKNKHIPQLSQKVVAERTVCYCSNFDLSLSEWVQMSENLKDFAENLLQELGKFFLAFKCFPFRPTVARVVLRCRSSASRATSNA